ncbi:MAG TPA: hypothetical protein VNV87_04740 [Acidimicrobiales bacterium]|nr:hypothetical protein [Acidimicrobiales bacterium]
MGVMYDYFRAPDREVARAVGLQPGGPFGLSDDADVPEVDGVETKHLDPAVVMGKLMAMVLDRPWEVGLVSDELIWPEGPSPSMEEMEASPASPWVTGPWLEELSTSFRDSLADVDDSALPAIANRWYQIEELWGFDDALALDFIEQFVAFARRAKEAGDRLYCWCCL